MKQSVALPSSRAVRCDSLHGYAVSKIHCPTIKSDMKWNWKGNDRDLFWYLNALDRNL